MLSLVPLASDPDKRDLSMKQTLFPRNKVNTFYKIYRKSASPLQIGIWPDPSPFCRLEKIKSYLD